MAPREPRRASVLPSHARAPRSRAWAGGRPPSSPCWREPAGSGRRDRAAPRRAPGHPDRAGALPRRARLAVTPLSARERPARGAVRVIQRMADRSRGKIGWRCRRRSCQSRRPARLRQPRRRAPRPGRDQGEPAGKRPVRARAGCADRARPPRPASPRAHPERRSRRPGRRRGGRGESRQRRPGLPPAPPRRRRRAGRVCR